MNGGLPLSRYPEVAERPLRRVPLIQVNAFMKTRIFQYSLVAVMLISSGLIPPPVEAQVRFLDRMQSPNPPSWTVQPGIPAARRQMTPAGQQPSPQGRDLGLTIPHWTSSFRTDGIVYPFTAVGADPSLGQTTVIPTVIIPYRLILPDGGVFDATSDLIDGVTPVAGIVNSPLFNNVPWNAGTTQLGTTQFGDALMRANFWSSIPGDRSGYHVLFSAPQILPLQVINVPPGYGQTRIDSAGTKVGIVDSTWIFNMMANRTLSLGISPQTLPIHVMSAIEGVDPSGNGFLGFHYIVNAGTAANPVTLPYIETGYFSAASAFAISSGTTVLGHEIAEWLNDPAVDNVVPAWQDPRAAHLCDNNLLEVGDPLEAVSQGMQVTLNERSYRLPDVTFLPWFSRDQHSNSVNGWYSFLNGFSSPSAACSIYSQYGEFGFDFVVNSTLLSTVLTGTNNTVNDKMQMVGYVTQGPNLPAGLTFDFSFDPTTLAFAVSNINQVNFPGSLFTVPVKINDRGQIAGLYVDTGGAEHGFLFSNGQYSSIDYPGAVATEALAIDNRGVPTIAGNYVDSAGTVHGFVSIAGQFSPVNAGFAVNLSVTGINDGGQMTGMYDLGGPLGSAQTFGFTGNAGLLTPLNYPGSASTLANSINNSNQVAGTVKIQFTSGYIQEKPFHEGGGNFQPLDSSGIFSRAQALGNNDAGIMVGSFVDPLGGTHAGVAVPAQLLSLPQVITGIQVPLPFKLQ